MDVTTVTAQTTRVHPASSTGTQPGGAAFAELLSGATGQGAGRGEMNSALMAAVASPSQSTNTAAGHAVHAAQTAQADAQQSLQNQTAATALRAHARTTHGESSDSAKTQPDPEPNLTASTAAAAAASAKPVSTKDSSNSSSSSSSHKSDKGEDSSDSTDGTISGVAVAPLPAPPLPPQGAAGGASSGQPLPEAPVGPVGGQAGASTPQAAEAPAANAGSAPAAAAGSVAAPAAAGSAAAPAIDAAGASPAPTGAAAQQAAALSQVLGANNKAAITVDAPSATAPSSGPDLPGASVLTLQAVQPAGQAGGAGQQDADNSGAQQNPGAGPDANALAAAAAAAEPAAVVGDIAAAQQPAFASMVAAIEDAVDSKSQGQTQTQSPTVDATQVVAGLAAQGTSPTQDVKTAAVAMPTRPASLPSPTEQIKMQINKGLAAANDTISIQLHPQDMGRVDIKLQFQDGTVSAVVTADHPETLQALKADASGLQQSLQNAGLNADANSMSFQLRNGEQQQQQQQSNQGDGRSRSLAALSATDDTVASTPLAALRAAAAQAAGGVDISI